jgi:hypothetical protein
MWTVSAQPVGLRKCTVRSVITLFRKRRFSGGLGGVGTSTLAIQYAWENHERYEGVWWLGAETKASIVDGLVALGTIFIPGLAEVKDLPPSREHGTETHRDGRPRKTVAAEEKMRFYST